MSSTSYHPKDPSIRSPCTLKVDWDYLRTHMRSYLEGCLAGERAGSASGDVCRNLACPGADCFVDVRREQTGRNRKLDCTRSTALAPVCAAPTRHLFGQHSHPARCSYTPRMGSVPCFVTFACFPGYCSLCCRGYAVVGDDDCWAIGPCSESERTGKCEACRY